jgi:uncharacterized protein DUF5666
MQRRQTKDFRWGTQLAPWAGMTKSAKTSTTRFRTFAEISALFSTLLLAACGGGPQAALPFAPSDLPSSTSAIEAADGIDAWGTLGGNGKGKDDKGKNDKGKGKDDDEDDEDGVNSGGPGTTPMVNIEGVISTATGVCPARTIVVGLQSVVTDAATRFEGGLCAQLVPLAEVEVRAERRADGTLLAKGVEFEDADVDEDDAGRWEGTVSGRSLTATCPAITFVVATRTVMTNAATVFEGGTCAQVLNDVNVRVRGTLQTNGTVLASRVEIRTEDEDEDEDDADDDDGDGNPHHGAGPHDGTVSSFRGACPTVTFNLKGLTIVTDAATTFVGGTCATLRPNVKVVVTGALAPAARRTFKAATITITRTH